ncbi:hypothetical protein VOLCADRAFT_57952 [Volvox carteri f. nagariensis]|uniref:Fatty acid hydroxylase domain-containing protein n=1 Tax=Volvox carteri f. nagariensis TaxID=3068 RepID=D8TPE2_VOLCA|nr:uncharacterized protein VOLCADRAFT_57952 [Volvox carteri f. nagariensis]EFJ50749.1 hypothetical protein VOLCADRAFT_57952 [Volvox carteri f. nagariensis]|eukprot:XP_002948342.1 hypothetical protein VOLCADRAFT_57952 [Volvox carteri f. nagariensis]
MDISALWTQAVHVFSVKLKPGTPEFGLVFYLPLVYWVVAGFYELLDWLRLPMTEKYKLNRREPGRGNTITHGQVVIRVLLQQLIQTALTLVFLVLDADMCTRCADVGKTTLHRVSRFILGMFVMDTWQYWIHRTMHTSPFLYKHLHSVHHSLMIPYASGALYNSILEGLLLDSLGGVVTHYAAGLDCQTALCLYIFATIKTVVDHSNYRGPFNPLHGLLPNCAAYHDIHHDVRGIKMNFSQPFFTHWDWLLDTFLDPAGMHVTVKEQAMQQQDARKAAAESQLKVTESKKSR